MLDTCQSARRILRDAVRRGGDEDAPTARSGFCAGSGLSACTCCGAVYRLPRLTSGERAECRRCGAGLLKYSRLDATAWLALALGALILFLIANSTPIASMTVQGSTKQVTLLDAVFVTLHQGWPLVALMTGMSAFVIPLLQLLILIWVLASLARGKLSAGFAATTRILDGLLPWSMVPVFLLAAVVSVVKLADMAAVRPGIGLLAFTALSVILTVLGRLRSRMLWRLAEEAGVVSGTSGDARHDHGPKGGCLVCGKVQHVPLQGACRCQRCDASLRWRRAEPLARTTALLLAAVILYLPANLYPVMHASTLTSTVEHTILGGIIALWQTGAWDIAFIVFMASVVVPMGKLLTLALLVWLAHRREPGMARQRTWMYEILERIGQWSMLDVYVVILLMALADFPGLVQVHMQAGALFFGLVVILTMLAAMSYDPRVVWDAVPIREPVASSAVSLASSNTVS